MSILIRELTETEKDSDEQCRKCKGNCSFEGMGGTWQCYGFVPKTNADRIRSMSDEELAEVLINLPNHLGCDDPNDGCMMDFSEDKLCSECVLEWLRQEEEK